MATLHSKRSLTAAMRGKYVVAWKKQANGDWKAAADMTKARS